MSRPIITLTTDFGLRDPWVGAMKGVIASIQPDAALVDLTHDIPRHAVTSAAYVLARCVPYFPPYTIHLAVVDPGVGGSRRPLVCSAGGARFVGPDNGLFADFCRSDPSSVCHAITNSAYTLVPAERSPTFQGRDVFAPAAAWLARGVSPGAFGPRVADLVGLESDAPTASRTGQIVWIDRFGNLISNVTPAESLDGWSVVVGTRELPIVTHYAQTPRGDPAALVNSDGVVEVFVNRGDAEELLGATIGMRIGLIRASS